MTITVVDKRKVPDHIYCGRGSSLGNPFVMLKEADRNIVCNQYQDWFYERVNELLFLDKADTRTTGKSYPTTPQEDQLLSIFSYIINSGKDVNLGCFCAPKRCHCDTIKTFLENKLEELDK